MDQGNFKLQFQVAKCLTVCHMYSVAIMRVEGIGGGKLRERKGPVINSVLGHIKNFGCYPGRSI